MTKDMIKSARTVNGYSFTVSPGGYGYVEDYKGKFSNSQEAVTYFVRHGWKEMDRNGEYIKMGLFLASPGFDFDSDVPDVFVVIGPDDVNLVYPY